MKRLIFSIFCIAFLITHSQAQSNIVPDKMQYCGIEITFNAAAKQKISEYIVQIYESPRYFNDVVNRATTYMPFIEEAFDNVGVPKDLKFLAIQESSLKGDAVSVSNAVGFWQLKEPTALEAGLRVNEKVDERMHIYRASEGAAIYFAKANLDFDNWVYAIIAYYEGLTGAVPYTEPEYYGSKKMEITEELHWYALKSIAHKIAYEEALSIKRQPKVWLFPISSNGEVNAKEFFEQADISEEVFREYNKWILGKKLPKNSLFTYYIPKINEYYPGHQPEPNKVNGGGYKTLTEVVEANTDTPVGNDTSTPPVATSSTDSSTTSSTSEPVTVADNNPPPVIPTIPLLPPAPPATSPSFLSPSAYVEFSLQNDLDYGVEYIKYDGTRLISEIADMYGIKLSNLLLWNNLMIGQEPLRGTLLVLTKPKKAAYHIVKKGETIYEIASQHSSSAKKIQKKNRMAKEDLSIFIGQKLYLKSKKPKIEKIIILKDMPKPKTNKPEEKPEEKEPIITKPVEVDKPQEPKEPVIENTSTGVTSMESVWIDHTVTQGETLWQISKKYGTKVDIIKRINKLESDSLSQGQVLRILAKKALLDKK